MNYIREANSFIPAEMLENEDNFIDGLRNQLTTLGPGADLCGRACVELLLHENLPFLFSQYVLAK
jgi:hypothetical protein